MKSLRIMLLCMAILGVAVSAYVLSLHYATGSTFCNFSTGFNCDLVNKSSYAEIASIPVAMFGVIGYFAIGIGALLAKKNQGILPWLLAANIIGLLFALYLTGVEAFVIKSYCIFCLASQAIIIITTIISFRMLQLKKNNSSLNNAAT